MDTLTTFISVLGKGFFFSMDSLCLKKGGQSSPITVHSPLYFHVVVMLFQILLKVRLQFHLKFVSIYFPSLSLLKFRK